MSKKLRDELRRVLIALVIFIAISLIPFDALITNNQTRVILEFIAYLIPFLLAGYDVLIKAGKNILHGQIFDECFLITIATLGAFGLVFFPESNPHMAEGAAVMIFYQLGEWFQSYAVGKSRKSISDMMDIAPEYANLLVEGTIQQVDPEEVPVDSLIVVKPGERVPLDGIVVEGESKLDTAALTGESAPRSVSAGSDIISGCVNMTGALTVRVTKPYGDSTVTRILELVEEASDKKARTEAFITRFARYYTPAVVFCALALAVLPPLFGFGAWATWVERGLIFLVVSCPCALVISVPLTFFSGIGAASKCGILIKGSNYLETLGDVDTIVFDKTGTLTNGHFSVETIWSNQNASRMLELAAHAEALSTHPLAEAVRESYGKQVDLSRTSSIQELAGRGISATVDGTAVFVGNNKLMAECGITALPQNIDTTGTILHVALDGTYAGYLCVADVIKEDSPCAMLKLHAAGVKKLIMLTGDHERVAAQVAQTLGLDAYHAELLPQDKVAKFEELMRMEERTKGKLAFVGDGINDAPVLMRADVGIAMGAMGSDAAIEAADVVLMDDKPSRIATAIAIARKTMRIAKQNIVFALGVKFAVLILAAVGIANMWLAVFADVGVAVLAILNAMRNLKVTQE